MISRPRLPGELDTAPLPGAEDPTAAPLTAGEGYWMPVAPVAGAAPVAATMAEVILVDAMRSLRADGGMLSAKGSGGGGGGKTTSGSTGGTTDGGTATLLTSYTSGTAGAYNITIAFTGTWTSALQSVFVAAANRISTIIVADVPDVTVSGMKIDDIRITAELKAIDGVGGVLGQAGPNVLRSTGYLPATGTMQFDTADADSYNKQGLFDEIVTHEMLHAIGFGSIWNYKNLISGQGFIGGNAVAEYGRLIDAYAGSHGGSTTLANGFALEKGYIPLETGGGAGTAGSHWAEAVFRNELMTGFLDSVPLATGMALDPLSAMTVASLKDLGYGVSASAPVDAYYLL